MTDGVAIGGSEASQLNQLCDTPADLHRGVRRSLSCAVECGTNIAQGVVELAVRASERVDEHLRDIVTEVDLSTFECTHHRLSETDALGKFGLCDQPQGTKVTEEGLSLGHGDQGRNVDIEHTGADQFDERLDFGRTSARFPRFDCARGQSQNARKFGLGESSLQPSITEHVGLKAANGSPAHSSPRPLVFGAIHLDVKISHGGITPTA